MTKESFDVNKEFRMNNKNYTPLECLCNHKKVNNESFQLLLDKGADVNKEFKIKDNACTKFYIYIYKYIRISSQKMIKCLKVGERFFGKK